jgi:hypothetical protein
VLPAAQLAFLTRLLQKKLLAGERDCDVALCQRGLALVLRGQIQLTPPDPEQMPLVKAGVGWQFEFTKWTPGAIRGSSRSGRQ